MDYALILLFSAVIAVGVVSAVVRTWSLHARLYSLEDRVSVVEGVTQREVKIRAAQSRPAKQAKDDELAQSLLATAGQPIARKKNFWETNLPRSAGG